MRIWCVRFWRGRFKHKENTVFVVGWNSVAYSISRSQVPLGNAVLTALRSVSIQDAAHPRMCSQATLGNKKKKQFTWCFSRSQVPLGNAVLTALRSVSIQDAAHPRMRSQATLGNKKKHKENTSRSQTLFGNACQSSSA